MTAGNPGFDLNSSRRPFWALLVTSLTIVIGVTVSASLVWAKAPTTICSGDADQAITHDPKNYRTLSELSNLIGGEKVVMIGEVHRTHLKFRKSLLRMIGETRGGRVCIFHELNRESTIEEHLATFNEPGFEDVGKFLKIPHALSKEMGWQEFTVDTDSSPEDISVSEVNRRDKAMGQRIAQLMATECDSAMMFIGKAHVLNEKTGRVNLKTQLDRAKISNIVINLQDPNDDRMIELWGMEDAKTVLAWNGICKAGKKLFRPDHPMIFLNQNLPPGRLVFPKAGDLSQWSSFDFTILAPDPDLE